MALHYWCTDTNSYKAIGADRTFYLENHIAVLGMSLGVKRVARRLEMNERDVTYLFHQIMRLKKPNQLAG